MRLQGRRGKKTRKTKEQHELPIMSHTGIKVLFGLPFFVEVIKMESALLLYQLRVSACP